MAGIQELMEKWEKEPGPWKRFDLDPGQDLELILQQKIQRDQQQVQEFARHAALNGAIGLGGKKLNLGDFKGDVNLNAPGIREQHFKLSEMYSRHKVNALSNPDFNPKYHSLDPRGAVSPIRKEYDSPEDQQLSEQIKEDVHFELIWKPKLEKELGRKVTDEEAAERLGGLPVYAAMSREFYKNRVTTPIEAGLQGATRDIASLANRVTGIGGNMDEYRREGQDIDAGARATRGEERTWSKRLGDAGQTITQSGTTAIAGKAIAGPLGVIALPAAMAADRAYFEGQEAGLEGAELYKHAVLQGGIEGGVTAVFQRLGLGGFEKVLIGGKGALKEAGKGTVKDSLKRAIKTVAEEVAEENTIEFLSAIENKFSGVDLEALDSERIYDMVVDTTLAAGLMGGGASGIRDATAGHARRTRLPEAKAERQARSEERKAQREAAEAEVKAQKEAETSETRKQQREAFQDLGKAQAFGREWAQGHPAAAREMISKLVDDPLVSSSFRQATGLPYGGNRQTRGAFMAGVRDWEQTAGPAPFSQQPSAEQTQKVLLREAGKESGEGQARFEPPTDLLAEGTMVRLEDGRLATVLGMDDQRAMVEYADGRKEAVPAEEVSQAVKLRGPEGPSPAEVLESGDITALKQLGRELGLEVKNKSKKWLRDQIGRQIQVQETATSSIDLEPGGATRSQLTAEANRLGIIEEAKGAGIPMSTIMRNTWLREKIKEAQQAAQPKIEHPPAKPVKLRNAEPPLPEEAATSLPEGRPKRIKSAKVSPIKESEVMEGIQRAFPGQSIKKIPPSQGGGYQVEFENGQWATIKWVDKLPVTEKALREYYGHRYSDEQIKKKMAEAKEAKGAYSFKFKDGTELDSAGLIRLHNQLADVNTPPHEAIHLAIQMGLLTPKEFQALAKKYSKPDRTLKQQEEDIAESRSAWNENIHFRERLLAMVRRLLSFATLGHMPIGARDAELAVLSGEIFSRKFGPRANAETSQSLDSETSFQLGDLANPGRTDESRRMVDTLDQIRSEAGQPQKISDEYFQEKALQEMKADKSGELKKSILDRSRHGGQLNPWETIAAQLYYQQAFDKGLKDGDAASMKEAVELWRSYRETRTDQARALRIGRDPFETPAERRARQLREAVTSDDKNLEKAQKQTQDLIDWLRKNGYDPSRLNEIAKDPQAAHKVLQQLRAKKAWLNEAWFEYWSNAILSGPLTHARNFIGNTVFFGVDVAKIPVEAIVNHMGAKDANSAQMSEIVPMIRAISGSFPRAASTAWKSWVNEENMLHKRFGLNNTGPRDQDRGFAIPGKLGTAIRSVGWRPLMMMDAFSGTIAFEANLARYAHRLAKGQGLSGAELDAMVAREIADPQSETWTRAISRSLELTFQNRPDGVFGPAMDIANKVRDLGRDQIGFSPLRFLFPFTNTPTNIVEQGTQYIPILGGIRAALEFQEAKQTGNWDKFTKKTASQLIGLMLLGAMLAQDEDDPWITGAANDWAHSGLPPQTIKTPWGRISYAGIEPISIALATTADMAAAIRPAIRSGNPMDVQGFKIWQSAVGQISNLPMLQGVSDLMRLAEAESAERWDTWTSNMAASVIPAAFKQPAKSFREHQEQRRFWGTGEERTSWTKRTIQKAELGPLLGIPETAQVDVWGKTKAKNDNPGIVSDIAWRLVSPQKYYSGEAFVGDRVIHAWNSRHPEEAFELSMPSPSYTIGGQKQYMSDDQYEQFSRLSGGLLREATEFYFADGFDPDDLTETDMDFFVKAQVKSRSLAREALIREWHSDQETPKELLSNQMRRSVIQAQVNRLKPPKRKVLDPKIWEGQLEDWEKDRAAATNWLQRRQAAT